MSEVTAILILAAGGSQRLGRPKQMVMMDGEPLVRHAARTALAAGLGPVFVVVGAAAELCAAALGGLEVEMILCAEWGEGMSRSIGAGVGRIHEKRVSSVLIMLCDQPGVTAAHLRRLAEAQRKSGTMAATEYEGDVGVPAVFSREMFPLLMALQGDQGARGLLRQGRERCAAVPLAAAGVDVDTPGDAARLEGPGASAQVGT